MDGLFCSMLVLGALVFVGHQAWLWYARNGAVSQLEREAYQRRSEQIQALSEKRALELLIEFPTANDFELATLMRDELLNMKSREQRYFQWATPETVARMRRTILVETFRAERGVDIHLDE